MALTISIVMLTIYEPEHHSPMTCRLTFDKTIALYYLSLVYMNIVTTLVQSYNIRVLSFNLFPKDMTQLDYDPLWQLYYIYCIRMYIADLHSIHNL